MESLYRWVDVDGLRRAQILASIVPASTATLPTTNSANPGQDSDSIRSSQYSGREGDRERSRSE